jgi:hypothetical protein
MLLSGSNTPRSKLGCVDAEKSDKSKAPGLLEALNSSSFDTGLKDSCVVVVAVEDESKMTIKSMESTIERFVIFDPDRRVMFPSPPPKLYHKTLWRSFARRLYQQQRGRIPTHRNIDGIHDAMN